MFVRWTVNDFIIGLLWLCVCVCWHTLSQGTVYIAKISLTTLFLHSFLSCLASWLLFSFCLLGACHSSFLILLCTHLFISLLITLFVSSCLSSSQLISSCLRLIFSHICPILFSFVSSNFNSLLFLCPHLFTSSLHILSHFIWFLIGSYLFSYHFILVSLISSSLLLSIPFLFFPV